MDIHEGQTAPDFTLSSILSHDEGPLLEQIHLLETRGKTVVLVFSPSSPVLERMSDVRGFQGNYQEFVRHEALVLIVSTASIPVLTRVATTHRLPFPLLADVDAGVSRMYGAYKQKSFFGRRYWGIERTTFLINPEGIVQKAWRLAKPRGHAREVIAALDAYERSRGNA